MPQKIKVEPNFQPPEMVLTGDKSKHGSAPSTRAGRAEHQPTETQTSATEGKKSKSKGPAHLQWFLHHPRSLSFLPVKQRENARHRSRKRRLLFKISAALHGTRRTGGAEPNRWIMVLMKYSHSSACSEARPQVCFPSASAAEGFRAWIFVFKLALPL